MWWLYFIGGLITGWLILSKEFWGFLFRSIVWLIVGGSSRATDYEETEEIEESPMLEKKRSNDLSEMPREELAELLRNEEVRVVKR